MNVLGLELLDLATGDDVLATYDDVVAERDQGEPAETDADQPAPALAPRIQAVYGYTSADLSQPGRTFGFGAASPHDEPVPEFYDRAR